ncbi:MAG TPA: hypothetical protein ENJ19_02950 [Gammaproteobacteria bacterium]|nr:hypothetical protein [Gammaproteobacteria bacterium]
MSLWQSGPAKWCKPFRGPLCLYVVLMTLALPAGGAAHPPPDPDGTLEEVVRLKRDGAPDLALRLLDTYQPPPSPGTLPAWELWERQRLILLASAGHWAALVERADALPDGVSPEFLQWAHTRAAMAELALSRGAAARRRLAALLWRDGATVTDEQRARWRRLLIKSYLADKRYEDARTAMVRYRQDYGRGGDSARELEARLALLSAYPAQAVAVLDGVAGEEARVLRWLARLRSGQMPPVAVLAGVIKALDDPALSPAGKRRLWLIAARAAQRDGDHSNRVRALEQALSYPPPAHRGDELLGGDGDELWQAYRDYGMELANRAQLLLGEAAPWFETARRIHALRPRDARALLATLAQQGGVGGDMTALAHQEFARRLGELPQGGRLLRALYLDSERFPRIEDIPAIVRYPLLAQALADEDMALASRLSAGLVQAPPGGNAVDWQLRRARLLLLGRQYDAAVNALERVMEAQQRWSRDGLDRYNQILFDLQILGRHEEALRLFDLALARAGDPGLSREILFWMADSYKALGHFDTAARYYLRSARLDDDPAGIWGQTARYHAAEALTDAGLRDDARRIYRDLLRRTGDPSRRAALKRKLDQLWLRPEQTPQHFPSMP